MVTEFAGAITEQREEIESLRDVLASIENKPIQTPATPTRRPKPRVDESKLETEVETSPRKKHESEREKLKAKKKKQKAERQIEQSTAAQLTTTSTWKDGNGFVPGMEWDDMPGNHKRAFIQARREFTRSGTAATRA